MTHKDFIDAIHIAHVKEDRDSSKPEDPKVADRSTHGILQASAHLRRRKSAALKESEEARRLLPLTLTLTLILTPDCRLERLLSLADPASSNLIDFHEFINLDMLLSRLGLGLGLRLGLGLGLGLG